MSPRRIADDVGRGPVPQRRVLAAHPLVPGDRVRVLEPRGAKQVDGFVDHGGPRRHPEPAHVLVEKGDIVAGQAHTDLHTVALLDSLPDLAPGRRAPREPSTATAGPGQIERAFRVLVAWRARTIRAGGAHRRPPRAQDDRPTRSRSSPASSVALTTA